MSAFLHSLTHGFSGFAIAYALVQVSMLVGLVRFGGPFREYILSPLVAVPLMLIGALAIALVTWPLPGS